MRLRHVCLMLASTAIHWRKLTAWHATDWSPTDHQWEDKDGTVSKGRGYTPEQSRQQAEDDYDDKRRGKK